ncbi:hypothetical protein D3C84_917320 [compost metagenome]
MNRYDKRRIGKQLLHNERRDRMMSMNDIIASLNAHSRPPQVIAVRLHIFINDWVSGESIGIERFECYRLLPFIPHPLRQ